ncbi:MAG: asparagine synthase (glutamine-hydrolyzing) [Pyrinomonadaceae bacterium]
MCGITGFITKTPESDDRSFALLDAMCKEIKHRGPDEQGTAIEGRAKLGMRRLSIIDLKTGQQPIYSTDKSKLIVFNGEIYNFRALKVELETKGSAFLTNSDTETIVKGFEVYGRDIVQKLRGMFAFAIWDKTDESLFIARDRVGKKPLFYALVDGEFVFGSELKCLIKHGKISSQVDNAALDAYLTFGYVPEEYCIFKGVNKLPPGHFLIFKNGEINVQQYWDFPYAEEPEATDENELVEKLRAELRDAVEARLISEVPLGAFLSGGVDSSAVVGMMTQILDKPVKTFSIGFNEDSFNELKFARIAAEHFNTEHHEFIVEPNLVEIVEELVWHFDEPFADSSALPTYMVSKLAREHVTVVLSGDGGDELFAGYTRYEIDKRRSALGFLPKTLRKNILRSIGEALPHGARGKNYLYNASLDSIARYVDSVSYFGTMRRRDLYNKDYFGRLNGAFDSGTFDFCKIAKSVFTGAPLDNLLYLDSKTYLPGDILTKVDRMSMAVSLEARVPLLDQNLIDFVVRKIPASMKLNGYESKYIFKKALKGMLPDEILYREKQGFGVPINEWINDQLRQRIHETLLENRTLERGYFNKAYIKTLLDEHSNNRRDHSHALWILWMLELWHRNFVDKLHY